MAPTPPSPSVSSRPRGSTYYSLAATTKLNGVSRNEKYHIGNIAAINNHTRNRGGNSTSTKGSNHDDGERNPNENIPNAPVISASSTRPLPLGKGARGGTGPNLKVLIIGAGIGGLTLAIVLAKHGVKSTVLERAPQLSPASSPYGTGASIHLPPNGTRVLRQIEMLEKVLQNGGHVLKFMDHLSYSDGTVISRRDLEVCEELYNDPWIIVHREDYLRVLYGEAQHHGVSVMFNCHINTVDFEEPRVVLKTGMIIKGDVVIGADGVWSTIREKMSLPAPPPSTISSGQMVYRLTFSVEELLAIPNYRLQEMLTSTVQGERIWLGPNGHVILCPIRGGIKWTMVLVCPDDIGPAEYVSHVDGSGQPQGGFHPVLGDADEMRESFRGWDDVIGDVLAGVGRVMKCKLCTVAPVGNWVKGSVALLGDAAHSMLPYLGQGTCAALEDSMALGTLIGMAATRQFIPTASSICFPFTPDQAVAATLAARKRRSSGPTARGSQSGGVKSKGIGKLTHLSRPDLTPLPTGATHYLPLNATQTALRKALSIYQSIRRQNSGFVAEMSRKQGWFNHLPDGDEQVRRDEMMAGVGWDVSSVVLAAAVGEGGGVRRDKDPEVDQEMIGNDVPGGDDGDKGDKTDQDRDVDTDKDGDFRIEEPDDNSARSQDAGPSSLGVHDNDAEADRRVLWYHDSGADKGKAASNGNVAKSGEGVSQYSRMETSSQRYISPSTALPTPTPYWDSRSISSKTQRFQLRDSQAPESKTVTQDKDIVDLPPPTPAPHCPQRPEQNQQPPQTTNNNYRTDTGHNHQARGDDVVPPLYNASLNWMLLRLDSRKIALDEFMKWYASVEGVDVEKGENRDGVRREE